MRESLLTIHVLAIAVWIGAGFYELWLGRLFLRSDGSAAEAPLIRAIYRSDLAVFGATLIAFVAGIALALTQGWGFFNDLWLGIKQAIMFGVLAVVAMIFPRAIRLGKAIDALPHGDGPVPRALKAQYAALEPWYALMRIAAVLAVGLAVFKPV
ncbi:hypothetical protein N0B51_11230 [Tsuneonella sp. YG55]|uniref:DUF2269 family protein n=1 Tax=Tsuneonella litorea TaxID=2976475 RepID=A0A9X2W2D1_9SPHN|nr:hypothetical protein [Tsuneonella litorea]MCT2559551.1 hypothetical protein [Tsuneonella litorea]